MRRGKRISEARRDDEAHAAFVETATRLRRDQLRLARLLVRLDESAHFVFLGCSSVAEYGERHGLSGVETRKLVAVGRALAGAPGLEEKVLSGRISLAAAAAIGKLLEHPELAPEMDSFVELAGLESARDFNRRVRQRLAEVRAGGPVVPVRLDLSVTGKEDLERAQVIASRRANRVLDESETVEVAVDHYLDSFDPERKPARPRRAPPTSQTTGRYVPAEVRRNVRARCGDRCAVPGCPNRIWLEDAHRRAHAQGGDREAANIVRLCRFHHDLLDLGRMTIAGSSDDPVFLDASGRPITARGPPA
jgi:hypothetical protein